MWSLPNISRLNAVAAAEKSDIERQAENHTLPDGRHAECEHCQKPATVSYLWYDPFSDDPKGVLHLCEEHDNHYGYSDEGYFTCYDCYRVHIDHYTWERYQVITEGGDTLCINCAAKREIADPDNWIKLTPEIIAAVDIDRIKAAKHLRVVGQSSPDGLEEIDNVEYDGSNGGRLLTSSSCEPTSDGTVAAVREILQRAADEGHAEAMLILDAAYQFSVSIGVYVREKVEAKAAA